MSEALDRRMAFATAVMVEAGALALRLRPAPGGAVGTLKSAQDWLTEADGAVERFLAERVRAAFPADGFQGEEGGVAQGGVLRWVVDPIDGTANFARGGSRFCVSLGLVEDRQPLLGVLAAPGEFFAACTGRGATLNGASIHAADTVSLDRATVEVGWSPRRPTADFLALAGRVMEGGAMMRSGGSGALALADVAAGRLDGYVELHINLWDVAGALPILAEAGAAISGFMAGEGPSAGDFILAAAPGVYHRLANLSRPE